MRVLIFDTETGGLDPARHSLLEVAALVGDLDTGEILTQFSHYVKSDSYVVDDVAREVHGISEATCNEKGLPKEEIASMFMDAWIDHGCTLLGGHNVDFDVRFAATGLFDTTVSNFESNMFTYRKIDTLPLVRLFSGTDAVKGGTLTQVIKELGIDMSDVKGGYHQALFDIIATFRIACRFRQVLTKPEVVKWIKEN